METLSVLLNVAVGLLGGYMMFWPPQKQRARFVVFGLFVLLVVSNAAVAVRQERSRAAAQAQSDRLQREMSETLRAMAAKLAIEVREFPGADPRLFPYLQYAYEWSYRGATHAEGDWARLIDPTVPLRKLSAGGEHRLDLGVFNDTGQMARKTILRVVTPSGMSVTRGGCWTRPYWSYFWFGRIDRTYECDFGDIDTNRGFHADYPLLLQFPTSGTYSMEYSIKAENVGPVEGVFALTAGETVKR